MTQSHGMTALSTITRMQFRPGLVLGGRLSALADCVHHGERSVVSAIRAAGYVPGEPGQWVRKETK